MTTETTDTDYRPVDDPRETAAEYATGTVDLDGTGAATHTVTLSGDLDDDGVGLMGAARVGDGSASLSSLTASSVDLDVTGGTADQVDVEWELVVVDDPFDEQSGDALSGGSAP